MMPSSIVVCVSLPVSSSWLLCCPADVTELTGEHSSNNVDFVVLEVWVVADMTLEVQVQKVK
jgi:hypothetical protein